MNKKLFFDILYVSLIIGVFAFMGWAYTFFKTEARDCVAQPFLYGAEKMENISCSCFQYRNGEMIPFKFNNTFFGSERQYNTNTQNNINISVLSSLLNSS